MADQAKLEKILSELVAFRTDTGHAEEVKNCFDYLEKFMAKHGLHTKRFLQKSHASLVASTQKTKQPRVLLQAHIDVVPAKDGHYKLTQANGRLSGRGVYDMKFAAACYLYLIEELQSELADFDLGFMFTSDEEIGGENGVGYLLEQGYGAGVCILPDGGSNWEIETGSNGSWIIRLTATGTSAHGSRPWEGDNAINKIMGVLLLLQELFGNMEPRKNSLTISKINGGSIVNAVPDVAEATVDMRFVDEVQYTAQRQAIEALVAASGLQLETVFQCQPFTIDPAQSDISSFVKLAQEIHGRKLGETHSLGCSDARYFVTKGIPTIVIRPTGDGAHSDTEWIEQADFHHFYELVKAYVIQTAKIT